MTEIGGWAFSACPSLTSITIPDSVTEIGACVFDCCTNLKSINVAKDNPYFFFSDGMLYCKDSDGGVILHTCLPTESGSVKIPDSVTEIGEFAFSDFTALTSITIPDSVTKIDQFAFGNCQSLTSITIPDGVTAIDEEAFYGCISFTGITIPDSVTKIGNDAFRLCENIQATYKGQTYDYAHIQDLYKAINTH